MLGGGLDFVIPKTSTVSPKANTADSRAGRKKGKKKNKSRVPRHRKTWRSKIRGHESKAFSPLVTFPGALRGLDSKANSSSLTNVICNFADRGTCCCVLSNLLCQTPRSVEAFAWDSGLVGSLESISEWDDMLILSGTMVLLWWLLCCEGGVFSFFRPLKPTEVTSLTVFCFFRPC